MNEVKRYDLVGDMDGNCNLNEARMELSDDGVYVKHNDYAALEEKCAALSAENAGLNKFIKDDCWIWDDKSEEYFDAADCMPETPATDAFLAEVLAQGVEMFAECAYTLEHHDHAVAFAAELRKGGNQ